MPATRSIPTLWLLAALGACGAGCAPAALPADARDWSDGWETRLAPPPEGSRPARPPGAGEGWSPDVPRSETLDLWYRNRLPDRLPDEPHLVFRAYLGELEAFLDGEPLYTFRQPAAAGRLTLHDVRLPADSAGRLVHLRIPAGRRGPDLGTPLLASRASRPFALVAANAEPVRDDLSDLAAGALLAVVGLLALGASALRRRLDDRVLLSFGAFSLLYGARLLLDSFLPILLGAPLASLAFSRAFITYLINVPAWGLAALLIGRGWRSTLLAQLGVFTLFAPVGIAADLALGTPSSLQEVNNALVILGGLNILGNLARRVRARASKDLRVVLAGSVVFMLVALNANLVALGLLPWSWREETLGFLVFVATLGYAAVRSSVAAERQLLALESELATAREIQRSLLPRAMPEVPGLAFHARYEPATSVAGDLYDFLAIDAQRVGLVVADVSGHGVPAALVASMVKVAVSSQARLAGEPASLLAEVNRTLCGEIRRSFVTATYLCFDAERRRVEAANGGHPAPLLRRRQGDAFLELGEAGPLLGRFPGARYRARATELLPGDRIVVYTDGIVEARDPSGEPFGEERLKALLRERDDRPADETAAAVIDRVRRWRGSAPAEEADDLTLVVVDCRA